MGIEPFIVPKRNVAAPEKLPENASRQDRVNALAQLLHSRGLTSSMTDARRLAEGMVDVEKKVVKQATQATVAAQRTDHADIADAAPRPQMRQTFNLNLPESFAHFVAHAAMLSHEEPRQSVTIPTRQQQVSFGRDEQHMVAEVPHIQARKQVFFEDAPPMTAARGYNGPKPQQVDFATQREEFLKGVAQKKMEAVTISATQDAIKMTRVESAPNAEIIEETLIVSEPELQDTKQAVPTAAPVPDEPKPRTGIISEPQPEQVIETNAEPAPVAEQPAEPGKQSPREDLAKKHGVDLFQMFKKK